MMHSNKRKLNILFFIAACVFVSFAATSPSGNQALVTKTNFQTDTGYFKNLKVLPKNISKEQLDMIMDHFKASLGVRCNFCHAVGDNGKLDFASDAKEEKNIARYMMHMTADINAKYFNSENSTRPDTILVVKCFTCHRGDPHPDEASMEQNMLPPMDSSNHRFPPSPPSMPADSNHKMPPPPNQ